VVVALNAPFFYVPDLIVLPERRTQRGKFTESPFVFEFIHVDNPLGVWQLFSGIISFQGYEIHKASLLFKSYPSLWGIKMKRIWRYIHSLIIINFIIEILYSFYMVFFVIGGGKWPLLRKAVETPLEVILKRRLYAIEAWIAVGGLCVYLAITELLPQKINLTKMVKPHVNHVNDEG